MTTIKLRRMLAAGAGGCIVAAAGTAVLAPPAHATTNDCDATWAVGIWGELGSGVSFDNRGRHIALFNEKTLDIYSSAQITSGRRSGDRVWIDRSLNTMPLGDKHPSTASVRSHGGWKQCGPFSEWTNYVYSWHRAIRVCYDPVEANAVCGRWYVDQ